jgi:hypothetical protein
MFMHLDVDLCFKVMPGFKNYNFSNLSRLFKNKVIYIIFSWLKLRSIYLRIELNKLINLPNWYWYYKLIFIIKLVDNLKKRLYNLI